MRSLVLRTLAGDGEIETALSDEAEIAAMLDFEAALAAAEAEAGLVPQQAAEAIEAACRSIAIEPDALAPGIEKDGVIGPAFVATLRKAVGPDHGRWLHFGATSQDLTDTALVLRLRDVIAILGRRLDALLGALRRLHDEAAATPLMAHTRMQRALPFTGGDKLDTWIRPLEHLREKLVSVRVELLVIQFGGPIGTRAGLNGLGDRVAEDLAARLGLAPAPVWHSARQRIVEFGDWLSLLSGTLGKIGIDVALMAQNEVGTAVIAGGGASSAMPHKSNPVAAELLVALARFNAGLCGTLHQALVHENERSGAAWTLEWLVLPQMAVTTGAALCHALGLVEALTLRAEPTT